MKKLILTLAGAVMTFCLAVAQDYQTNIFGVYAGLNVAKISAYGISTDSKLGFHVGGSYERLLMNNRPLYLETGLQFSQKGFKISERSGSTSYLEIPVMVNYKFHFGDALTLYPSAGIYYAFGIGGKEKDSVTNGEYDLFGKTGGFKRSDLGIRFGVTFGIRQFNVGVGYEFGLMNISKIGDGWFDDSYESDSSFPKAKNGNLFVSVGYKF